MTPDDLLRLYPCAALRFLRGRLGESQSAFAAHIGAATETVAAWETGRAVPSLPYHRRIVRLLALQLVTQEGAAFVQALGRGESPEE
jgi:DNA-binding transcriptional regulator YiaG